MKTCLFVFGAMLVSLSLFAFCVPYSETPLYTEANLLSGMQRVNPEDNAYETKPTKVWLWQDDTNLCFAFEAVIDSTFTPGPVSTRDTSNKADYLRIQLITIPDAYYSYLYNFYATGNLYDAVRETGRADIGFNTNYTYTSTHTDSLWKVQGQIPLGELRFRQTQPYNWKIILTRHHDSTSEDFSLPWVLPKMQNDYFAKALDIQLSHPVKRKLDITFKPYIVKSYDLVNKTDSFDPDNLGLDIAFNPAQRTRIKLSLNPDFSDVPPDAAADIYNSKYPRYYVENRFFFTEDIDAYGVPLNVFNSRRIVKPSVAFKATGNSKNLNWGILGALDKEIVENGVLLNRDDYYQVLSIIPQSKTLKLANSIVSRVNKDYYNHVFSGTYRWDYTQDIRFSSWNAFSVFEDDRSGDTDPLYGSVHNLALSLTPGNWYFNPSATYVSRNMIADAGYLYDRFYHKLGTSLGWDSAESLDYVSYQGFSLDGQTYSYYAQHNSESAIEANYYINFRPKYGLSVIAAVAQQLDILDQSHDTQVFYFTGSFFKWQPLSMQLQYSYNNELIYSLADTYASHSLYGNIWGTISQVLSYDLSCTYKDYAYPKGILADYGGLLPFGTPLDDNYLVFNGELSYTPHQKMRIACGSGFSTYESGGIYNDLNLYGNLRYEFKPNCFLYSGFNTNQLQDYKSTYNDPLGHYLVYSATAYAKVSITL